MNAKHTPGPWHDGGVQKLGYHRINAEGYDEYTVCPAVQIGSTDTQIGFVNVWSDEAEEAESNCRLVAAAPELLAALQQLITDGGPSCDYNTWRDAKAVARAAIIKATGATS